MYMYIYHVRFIYLFICSFIFLVGIDAYHYFVRFHTGPKTSHLTLQNNYPKEMHSYIANMNLDDLPHQ
jgi:hypothetical protein